MDKRLSVIFIFLFVTLMSVMTQAYSSGGESYPSPADPAIVTASIGTSDTTVTASVTGYWIIQADQDMRFNFGAAATSTHPRILANQTVNIFPVRIHKDGSTRTPSSIHFIADTTTGNVYIQVIAQ